MFTNVDESQKRSDVADAFGQTATEWLTRDVARARWKSLLQSSTTSGWSSAGAVRTLVDLDAERQGLPSQNGGDYNRSWNMSILTLLQRAGALEILSTSKANDEYARRWEIQIKSTELLSDVDSHIWDSVMEIRNAEQRDAIREFNTFRAIMESPSGDCVIRRIFEVVQGEIVEDIPDCGHCPACRTGGARSAAKSLDREAPTWNRAPTVKQLKLPRNTLISPEDPLFEAGLERLLLRLATAGFEQFIVPDESVSRSSAILARSPARLGFLIGWKELQDLSDCSISKIATAVLLPFNDAIAAELLDRLRDIRSNSPQLCVSVIGKPERHIRNRRLDQTVSTLAPYQEHWLDAFGQFVTADIGASS
jgi:ATP-dependent DNA helicase RecQ